MTAAAAPLSRSSPRPTPKDLAAAALTVIAFLVLFSQPMRLLALDWWNDPEAGHGLLLAPVAAWLTWRSGLLAERRPAPVAGALLLSGAVVLRYVSGLAAELFTMRVSMLGGLAAIVVYLWGWRQLLRWWMPFTLLLLSIPLPSVVVGTLALPLQFKASQMGAFLLEARGVPVELSGNIIGLPGHRLFVTEACSGLRSLTALLSLGVLVGGLWLQTPLGRVALVLAAIPVAIVVNAVRVFLTGFLVYFVGPEAGQGFMHTSEGWSMFLVALGLLGGIAWLASRIEVRLARRPA
jgi:exosortase